jgi:hypothetical protein
VKLMVAIIYATSDIRDCFEDNKTFGIRLRPTRRETGGASIAVVEVMVVASAMHEFVAVPIAAA